MVIAFTAHSCVSKTYLSGDVVCVRSYTNDHLQVHIADRQFVIKGDTSLLNEMRFYCGRNAILTAKVMYDSYGKWDKIVNDGSIQGDILIWENVDLHGDNRVFDVFTSGVESRRYSYSALMVFNESGADALYDNDQEVDILSTYFLDLAKTSKDTSDFYEQYWMSVNPSHWERLQMQKQR